MRAFLRWMPIVLNAYIRQQKSLVNNFWILPKAPEKEEEAKPQVSSWEETIKIMAESNKIETDMKGSTKNKRVGYLKKKNDKNLAKVPKREIRLKLLKIRHEREP